MWSGWNSTITKDDLPAQKIGYLANIGAPPTQHDVVNETMKRNVTLAEECKEDYIATTHDLAIAKPASQLQDTMQPRYDNVFIWFGAFHIMFSPKGHSMPSCLENTTIKQEECMCS